MSSIKFESTKIINSILRTSGGKVSKIYCATCGRPMDVLYMGKKSIITRKRFHRRIIDGDRTLVCYWCHISNFKV